MQAQKTIEMERRAFIKRALCLAALPALSAGLYTAARRAKGPAHVPAVSAQQWMGAADAPAALSWRTQITKAGEPGAPLVMSGTIYEADGRTPASGVILYVYHTDATGYYNQPRNALPARLRGWMRTGADGRYEFRTIRPASYPDHNVPAHIHTTVARRDYPEYWIDSYWFDGDPFITPALMSTLSGRGGFNSIIGLLHGKDDIWYGRRDIRLERV
jgi:protocatechuate 3,4-dioxygenase, beta subunit